MSDLKAYLALRNQESRLTEEKARFRVALEKRLRDGADRDLLMQEGEDIYQKLTEVRAKMMQMEEEALKEDCGNECV